MRLSRLTTYDTTTPSFRPERAKNERAEWRNLLPNAGRLDWTVGYRNRFLDSASLRSV